MIGKQKSQLSLLDSAFSKRQKRSRSDERLKKIEAFVDWDKLEGICKQAFSGTKLGRPTIPIKISLKCLILQYLYNLSDPELEDALIDRFSFQRFLGISFDEEIPDFTTHWRFRERLIKAKLLDKIFEAVLKELEKRKIILRKGTLIDATLVEAARKPGKRNKGEDDSSEGSGINQSQRDRDATRTKKGNKYYYGYKGHIGVDQGSNVSRKRSFTSACVHDSQEMDKLVSGDERSVFADKAYAKDDLKRQYRKDGVYCGVLDKGRRGRPLGKKQKKANRKKSGVRNAVERPFAYFKKTLGYRVVRYVNLKRNELHFTFLCIIHNIQRGIALTAFET